MQERMEKILLLSLISWGIAKLFGWGEKEKASLKLYEVWKVWLDGEKLCLYFCDKKKKYPFMSFANFFSSKNVKSFFVMRLKWLWRWPEAKGEMIDHLWKWKKHTKEMTDRFRKMMSSQKWINGWQNCEIEFVYKWQRIGDFKSKTLTSTKNKEITDSYHLQISILISFSSDFVRKGIKNKFNFSGL